MERFPQLRFSQDRRSYLGRDDRPAFVDPGGPRQNDFVESFNVKLRDELLEREWFRSRADVVVLVNPGPARIRLR